MNNKQPDFDYDFVEIESGDTRIVFISDEKTDVVRPTDIHMHSFWELFYVQKGELSVKTEKNSYTLYDRQALIIPPKVYHNSLPEEHTDKKSVFFTFEKIKSKENGLFENLFGLFSACGFYKLNDDGSIEKMLEDIIDNLKNPDCFKELRVEAKAADLILHLYDAISPNLSVTHFNASGKNTYWVYKYEIDRLIDAYYTNDVSLDLLSDKLYISTQSIKRIIMSVYGKTFNELKLELKMRNAKRLLRETNLNISEIATETGYSTTRGFLTAFSKYEGTTPTEYRKKYP